jgi:preprotein translocase subunit SecF
VAFLELIKPNTKIDFVGMIRYTLALSWILILVGIVSLVIKGGPTYGIDFRGGTLFQVKFAKQVTAEEIRAAAKGLGVEVGAVQDFGPATENEFLVNIETKVEDLEKLSDEFQTAFLAKFGKDSFEIRRTEAVGPKVGKDLRQKALLAVLCSCIGMLIYMWFRFEFRFGLGAVLGLAHDVLIVMTFLSLTNTPIDLTVLAALLTIVGYSVNDTIIVCDRIRENMPKMTRQKFPDIINISVNQTLSRTILTVGTVFLATLSLYIFGGGVIHDFAFTMLVGIITGTYSSVFVACPVAIYWEKLFVNKDGARARR